jgi:hypothetical protein
MTPHPPHPLPPYLYRVIHKQLLIYGRGFGSLVIIAICFWRPADSAIQHITNILFLVTDEVGVESEIMDEKKEKRKRRDKTLLIMATMFWLQRTRAVHELRSDH